MKAKQLIDSDDFVLNPNGYFGKKIPHYHPCEGENALVHGSINYGVFRATEYANKKAAPLLDALVTFVYEKDEEEKEKALEALKEIAEQYTQIK